VPVAIAAALALDPLVTLDLGGSFTGAEPALIPALGVLPPVPLAALANQIAALRLRPELRLVVLWSAR
jgi:hypothetical protein